MMTKALNTIKEYKMLERGDKVAVGFSGGADSTALLYLLLNAKEELGIDVFAVHLNHMLRGDESSRDELFCRNFCNKLGIKFYCEQVNIKELALKRKKSIEETAREARYKLYKRTGANKTATAHTLSDSLETVLINLTRGTGIDGLCGIPAVRGNIVRPLINCTRTEIENYCAENALEYVTDSTNFKDIYTRNKIRLNVLPVLKEISPGLEDAAAGMINLLNRDAFYLNNAANEKRQEIKTSEGYSTGSFLKLPEVIGTRILGSILKEQGLEVSHSRIDLMYKQIKNGQSGLQFSKNYFLECENDSFYIKRKQEEQKYFEIEVCKKSFLLGETVEVFTCKNIRAKVFECKEIENIENYLNNSLKKVLDYDKIGTIGIFRQRKAGDSFTPAGRGCTKSLKKLFNEAKIPPLQRSKQVIFESEGKVVWVQGFGASALAAPTGSTKRILELIIE